MATIKVYIDDGRVFEYDVVDDPGKVREHVGAIAAKGYRHNNGIEYEHYPVHRIDKIKGVMKGGVPTYYVDSTSGT